MRRTGRTRACDVRVGAGRFMTPARVFPMCTRQFTIHVIIDIKHTQHARQMERRVLVPTSVRVVLHEALCHALSSSPRDRRDATLYDAFTLDTEPRRLAQRKASHRRRGARTSATCYTRGRARTRYLQHAVEHISELYWCMLFFF